MISVEEVGQRLEVVRARIRRAGRDPDQITVLAVTKGFPAAAVEAAQACGLADIGENYAQELVAKAAVVAEGVRWHFIGRIQTNKIRALARLVELWHAVDRPEVGAALARHRAGARVLVQVNVSGEPTKGGCRPDQTAGLVDELRASGIDVRGLMTVAPAGDPETARPVFRSLAELAAALNLEELSMGMTSDLEIAVQEGATIVRVGEALFGPRPSPPNLRR
jgi:pyridoxal phosphate enzyme (YggS family)